MMNRSHTFKASAILLGALALCALSVAQNGGQSRQFRGGFGGGAGRGNSFFMLRRDDVQSDLQLTTDQKTKIQSIFDSMRGQRGQGGDGGGRNRGDKAGNPPSDADREARRKQMEAQRADMDKKLKGILSDSQVKRLKEISIQTQGNMAIMNDDVQSELGITSDQKAKIKSLRDKMGEAMQSIFQKMQDNSLSRDDVMKSMQKNNDVMKEELGKVLTHSQADKLKAMGGAPFKADPSENQGFGGFGGRRGGGGGRRGGGGGGGNLGG